jgi:hypothetical protein
MAPCTPWPPRHRSGTTADLPWYHRTVRHFPKIARWLARPPVFPSRCIITSNANPPPIPGNPTAPERPISNRPNARQSLPHPDCAGGGSAHRAPIGRWRSAGFQTGLTCAQVAKCPPNHPRALSRFGNRRSARAPRTLANPPYPRLPRSPLIVRLPGVTLPGCHLRRTRILSPK